jgi:hypothetical protein
MKALTIVLFTTLAAASADSLLPEAYARTRYEQTRTESPFVLASIVKETPPGPVEKFSANMFITGLGRVNGVDYVNIIRTGEEQTPVRLEGTKPNADGISLQQIVWSDSFAKSRVKLAKDGIVEEIGFDENARKPANVPPHKPQTIQQNGGRIRIIK